MKTETERWLDMASRLGIEIVAPCELDLAGVKLHFTALLPQFGGPRGMVVDSDSDAIWQHRNDLIAAGYGFSCVACSDSDDLETAQEMLSDWGWTSDLPKPDWLRC